MSWYFLGGFSAYLSVPSGRRKNHSGMLLEPRVVGRAVDREVQGDVEAVLVRGRDERAEVLVGAELGVDRVVAPGLVADRVRAAGVARLGRRGCCCGPCGWCGRSGGSAACRGRRSRARRCSGPAPATPLKPPHERGKSSYQEPKRASVRSTSTSSVLGQLGGLGALLDGLDELEQRGVERGVRDRWRSPRRPPSGARLASPLARSAAARSRTTPSLSSPLRSGWPNSTLRASSSRQPAKRSTHAWMFHCVRPGFSTVKAPSQRTPLWWASTGDQRRLAPALVPGVAPAHDGAQHLVAIAEDVRRHLHRVGHGALDWPATAVDGRRRVRDPDAARRFGLGAGGHVHPSFPHATSTNQRCPTASHLAAGREAWRIGAAVRRLARGGGSVVVAGAAARARPIARARPTRRRRLSLHGAGSWPIRDAPVSAAERDDVPRAPRILDRRLGGLRRRHAGDQRPGPLRPRVVCTARVRRTSAACA